MNPSFSCPLLYRTSIEAMGCLFECFLASQDADEAVAVGREALDVVARLDAQLSHYREDSDICRLNRHAANEWVRVEPELFALLQRCVALTVETEGAFDVATGALLDVWGFHRGSGRVASDVEVRAALDHSGSANMLLDAEQHLVHFTAPRLTLNLGAIGKGYALDRAADTVRFYGLRHGVIHGGRSTIVALGSAPSGEAWSFVIRDPRDRTTPIETVQLRDAALSTSSSCGQFVEADGVRYGHVLDPRSGYPAEGPLSVSVVAPTGADADALSTALYVMGTERAVAFCGTHPEIAAIILEEDRHDSNRQPDSPLPPLRVTRIGLP